MLFWSDRLLGIISRFDNSADAVRGAGRPVDEGKAVGMQPRQRLCCFLICLTARPTAGICDRRNGFRETVELVSPLMSALGQFARRGPSAHVKAIYMSWKYRSGGPRGYHHGNL